MNTPIEMGSYSKAARIHRQDRGRPPPFTCTPPPCAHAHPYLCLRSSFARTAKSRIRQPCLGQAANACIRSSVTLITMRAHVPSISVNAPNKLSLSSLSAVYLFILHIIHRLSVFNLYYTHNAALSHGKHSIPFADCDLNRHGVVLLCVYAFIIVILTC